MTDTEPYISYSQSPHLSCSIPANGNKDAAVHWFPMRVSYGRSLVVYQELEKLDVECFLPVSENMATDKDGFEQKVSPLVSNLLFVHATKVLVTELKQRTDSPCRFLRFITYIPHSAQHNGMTAMEQSAANRIIIVPDQEMQQFVNAVTMLCHRITLIPYSETFNHIGRKIRILQGPLAGSVGTLRRIKNNKYVHIDCGGILTAQLQYMPKEMYELIETT